MRCSSFLSYCAEDRLDPTGTVLQQGRCARVVQRQMRGSMVLANCGVPQLQSIEGRRQSLSCRQSQISLVQSGRKTIKAPQLQYVARWLMPLVVHVVLDMPVVVLRQVLMVQTLQTTVEVPQVQYLCGCGRRRCDLAATSSRQFREVPQLVHRQDVQVLRRGDFVTFRGIFALRPAGRECPLF